MKNRTKKFLLHLSSGYGAIWGILMLVAIVTNSRIDAGDFGVFGFPVIAFFYALFRMNSKSLLEVELDQLRKKNELLQKIVDND